AAGNEVIFSSLDIDVPTLAARQLELSELGADDAIWPLTGRIDISAPDARWLIDFPVNHLNSRAALGSSEFQVETGPVLVPASLADSRDAMIAGGVRLGVPVRHPSREASSCNLRAHSLRRGYRPRL